MFFFLYIYISCIPSTESQGCLLENVHWWIMNYWDLYILMDHRHAFVITSSKLLLSNLLKKKKLSCYLQKPDTELWSRRGSLWSKWTTDPEKPGVRRRRRPLRGPWGPEQTGASLGGQNHTSVASLFHILATCNVCWVTTFSRGSTQPGVCGVVMETVVPEISDFWIFPYPPGLYKKRRKKSEIIFQTLWSLVTFNKKTVYKARRAG